MKGAEKTAKTEREWWELVRADLRKWNSTNHPDDNLSLIDYVGELTGSIPVYGFRVVRDDRTDSGYGLVKV